MHSYQVSTLHASNLQLMDENLIHLRRVFQIQETPLCKLVRIIVRKVKWVYGKNTYADINLLE